MATNENIRTQAVIAGTGTASGTNVYSVSIPEVKAYLLGLRVMVKFPNGNTSSSSLNINGLGAVNILKGATSNLSVGDILQNQMIELSYDGASFQIIGATPAGYAAAIVGNNLFNYYNFK